MFCPILKGVGYSALTMVFLENVYYIIIVAWTLYYIMNTFFSLGSGLPWSDCEKGGQPCLWETFSRFLAQCCQMTNLIPSFPWIAPRLRARGHNPRKGRDQILQRRVAEP